MLRCAACLCVVLAAWGCTSRAPAPQAPPGDAATPASTAAPSSIEWLPWGPQSFQRAQREHKLVLLCIAPTWCHGCHRMDATTYADPRVIDLVSRKFVAIRADRDRRPDLDARYQQIVKVLGGTGGWPLTVFLTSDGAPLFGGTFFPAETTDTQMGLLDLLPLVVRSYREQGNKQVERLARVRDEALRYQQRAELVPTQLSEQMVEDFFEQLRRRRYTPYGGIGGGPGPKFPQPYAIELAMWMYDRKGDQRILRIVEDALRSMAAGGIHDHVGGGFHRYTGDRQWAVPRFEKLLSVNAALLRVYLEAYQVTGEALYRDAAVGIIRFVDDALSDRERGGFYGSRDAAGVYYTWTVEELQAALAPDEAALLVELCGVKKEASDIPGAPGRNVLRIARPLPEAAADLELDVQTARARLASAWRKLRAARRKRPAPRVDTTLYTDSNALMISAYLEAAVVLDRPDCRVFALKTLDRLRRDLRNPQGGMYHYLSANGPQVHGLLRDQVMTALAMLDAYEQTGTAAYVEGAGRLADFMLRRLWDRTYGGFLDREPDDGWIGNLLGPRREIEDAELPAGNAAAAILLDRLAVVTGDRKYSARAGQVLECLAGGMSKLSYAGSALAVAVLGHVDPPVVTVIVGDKDAPRAVELRRAALSAYRTGKRMLLLEPSEAAARGVLVAEDGLPQAFVRRGDARSKAVRAAEELKPLIAGFGR